MVFHAIMRSGQGEKTEETGGESDLILISVQTTIEPCVQDE